MELKDWHLAVLEDYGFGDTDTALINRVARHLAKSESDVIDNDEWNHLPCAMGKLKLKRKEVLFEPVKAGSMPQQRIPCANVGTKPLQLSSELLPAFASFATEPQEIAPGEEGDIVITINGDMLPPNAPRSFSVVVEGVEGRISDRTIKVKIEK